ncbi:MAG TPA: hypothetical protein VG826_12310 [Pirellulales bacterium]|nr:hypothetical protein [Pirellulales bacterium]
MPQTRDIALEELAADGSALPLTETRVDAAHSIGDAISLPPLAEIPLAEMPVEQAITELVRVEGVVQLQAQADQLGAHLRERERQLEHREAQVNARIAEFEQEVRDARAWLAQRNDELNEREARLDAREMTLKEHDAGADGSSHVAEATVPPAGLTLESEHGSPDEALCGAEWEERKRAIGRASQEIDLRRRTLEQLHDEISQIHGEALELHLATQELQAQLRSSLGVEPAEQALRAAHERVARRYQKDAARLLRRREELEWLRSDLAREHAKLERRYQEFKGWIETQRPRPGTTESVGEPRGCRPADGHDAILKILD